jgi:RNA polymerase sigma factor (sigma-70 family)
MTERDSAAPCEAPSSGLRPPSPPASVGEGTSLFVATEDCSFSPVCAARGGEGARRADEGAGVGRRRRMQPPSVRSSSLIELVNTISDSCDRPSGQAAKREAVLAVQVGLANLPQSQQDAVRLRHLEGNSVAETAAAMGRPPAAVRGLLQRARKSLRQSLRTSSRWFYSK